MSSFRKLFPTLKTNYPRGQSSALSSDVLLGPRHKSMDKFTLKNMQRLNEPYTEDEPQTKVPKEKKDKGLYARIPSLNDQSTELL